LLGVWYAEERRHCVATVMLHLSFFLLHSPTRICARLSSWKPSWSTRNFNTVCRTVSIRIVDHFSSAVWLNLAYWEFYIV